MKEATVAGSTCNISQLVITMSEAELACKLLGKLHMLLCHQHYSYLKTC